MCSDPAENEIGTSLDRSMQIVSVDSTESVSRWGLPEWFAVTQVVGPALLYLPGSQGLRVPLRIGVFALSLVGLAWCWRTAFTTRMHCSWILLSVAAVYMTGMLLHPSTNTLTAGLAQIGMHLAVAAPLFWAPHYFRGDFQRLGRILAILCVLNGASVAVGILQLHDPRSWMPSEFSSNLSNNKGYLGTLFYRAADGSMKMRPPGLGDYPGAASFAGTFLATIALVYLGRGGSFLKTLFAFAMGTAGVVIILLSHVRSSLILVVSSGLIYWLVLIAQGRLRTALSLAFWIICCGLCSFTYAFSFGGRSTWDRFATLVTDNPYTVYENSARLFMVNDAFDSLLVNYPLGAGLGRWGMMRTYFGSEDHVDSPRIWAEVQFQAWVLDGGIVLLSLYLSAIVVAAQRLVRLTLWHPSWRLREGGAAIVMISAGPILLMFTYCPFHSQAGAQFWLLIGAFEGLAQAEEHRYSAESVGDEVVASHHLDKLVS